RRYHRRCTNVTADRFRPGHRGATTSPGPLRVRRPDGADGRLVAKPVRDGRALAVGVVPALAVARRPQWPAAGHLEMAGGVRPPHPIPGIPQPVLAIRFALVREPGDLIVAPDPDASLPRLPRAPAGAPVVDLDQVREVL